MGKLAVLLHVVSAEAVAQLEVPKWCHSQWLAAGTGGGLGQNGSWVRSPGSSRGPLHKGLSQSPLSRATWVFSQTGLCVPGMNISRTRGEDAHPRGPSLKHQVCGHSLSSFSCIYLWLAGSWLLHACFLLLQ